MSVPAEEGIELSAKDEHKGNSEELEHAKELANVCAHGARNLKPLHKLNEAIQMH